MNAPGGGGDVACDGVFLHGEDDAGALGTVDGAEDREGCVGAALDLCHGHGKRAKGIDIELDLGASVRGSEQARVDERWHVGDGLTQWRGTLWCDRREEELGKLRLREGRARAKHKGEGRPNQDREGAGPPAREVHVHREIPFLVIVGTGA